MEVERMKYSYKSVLECIDAVKKINGTVAKRNDHAAKMFEIEKAYDFCFEKTKCCLFEWDWSPHRDYHKAVNDDLYEKSPKRKWTFYYVNH